MTKRTKILIHVWKNIDGVYKNVFQKFEENHTNKNVKILAVNKVNIYLIL